MREFNYKKKVYRAAALQYEGTNADTVKALLPGMVSDHGSYLIIRYTSSMDTLIPGDWVRIGENGVVKCYSDDEFKLKYEPI